jgi:hypothetical protein
MEYFRIFTIFPASLKNYLLDYNSDSIKHEFEY